jgi:dihydrofolate reductase
MEILAYATLSANGYYIIPETDPTPEEIMADFMTHAQKAGNVIIGRATYDDMVTFYGGVTAFTSQGIEVVVLSGREDDISGAKVVVSPGAAIDYLRAQGKTQAMVGGGAATISAFLEAGLVTDLRVNVLPLLGFRGLQFLASPTEATPLQLVQSISLPKGSIQLHYKMERQ